MSVTVRTNHASNPNFELDAAGWTPENGATIDRTTVSPISGTGSGRILGSATAGANVYRSVAAAPGEVWSFSLDYKAPTAPGGVQKLRITEVGGTARVWETVLPTSQATPARFSVVSLALGAGVTAIRAAVVHDNVNQYIFIDNVLIEKSATVGTYFDGSFVNAGSIMYAWTAAAHASTSTATLYTPVVTTVPRTTYDPCPRVEVTVADLTPTTNTVTVWRTADGKRQAVQGARERSMVGSDFVIDYAAPLARTLTYDIEVTAGISAGIAAIPATTNVAATQGCIQDPLVPSTAMPVYGGVGPNGELAMLGSSLKNLEYAAEISVIAVLGSPDPVGIMGQRLAAKGVAFNMVTEAAQEATDMRGLILSSPLLLVRPLPGWAGALPGACYIGPESVTENPITEAWGGNKIEWHATSPLLASPSMNIVVPLWTYQDVQDLWTTYQQAQTALTGKTYLDALKSPSGA